MGRKGENVRKRADGRWEARYEKDRDSNGRIKYGYAYGKSYLEAKEKRKKALKKITHTEDDEFDYDIVDNKFTTIIELWRRTMRHSVKDSTYANYEAILNNHIIPIFGSTTVTDLTNTMVCSFIQTRLDLGLTISTVRVILGVLKNILSFAQELRVLPKKPVKFPHLHGGKSVVKTMDEIDYLRLQKYLLELKSDFDFGILFCMCTGIRVGELSGLCWGDIDFEHGIVLIQRTVTRIKNVDWRKGDEERNIAKTILHIGTPKSTTSIREIPLPDFLIDNGRLLKKDNRHFVLTGNLQCMEPRAIQRHYHRLLEKCSIPPLKIHALRHQFSCRWIEQGFDTKSLSEILGHSSVKTTLDIYVHINTNVKKKYMNQIMNSF